MASRGLRISSKEAFYALLGEIRDTNVELTRRRSTETITYDFRLGRGDDGSRVYIVDLSHSAVELAALRTVLSAAALIGESGGLQAAGARADWGMRGLAASLATGRGRLFSAQEVAEVWEAEKVLDRRRRRAETVDALVACGVPAGCIDAAAV